MNRTPALAGLAVVVAFLALLFAGHPARSGSSVPFSVSGDEATADSAVTPLVSPHVRRFVESKSDFGRSSVIGRIVVPLLLILLVERELLAVLGRAHNRLFLVYGLPLIASFAMLMVVRIREYLD